MSSKTLAILAIVGLLLVGGAGFGVYTYKMNSPSFRAVGLNVKIEDDSVCDSWVTSFEEVLNRDEVLERIVEKSDYATKMEVSADDAVAHLRDAVHVVYKKKTKSFQVGLNGLRKQDEQLTAIASHVFDESKAEVAQSNESFREFYLGLLKQSAP